MHALIKPQRWLAALTVVLGMMMAPTTLAHHGWAWASAEEFELTGKITDVRLGNPHGQLTVDAAGEQWVVEVGQPWRNERAGLSDELLARGQVITAHGHRSSNPSQRLLKAERIVIDGKRYNLYPERKS